MIGEVFLWVLACLGLIFWLAFRLNQASKHLQTHEIKHEQLKREYDSLKSTLATRGRRLDVLLSTISEVVLRVDEQGRVLGGNEQAELLFNLKHSIVLPQSILVFYRDSEWLKAFQQAIDALPEQRTLPEMKVNGRVLLPRLAALSDKEALLLCLDVTAYTRLQQKQKSLLENLMHDLKTPLTSLLGYARSIETFADDEALRHEATSVIVKEAKHINNLMNSMLTLNQIDHDKTEHDAYCSIINVHQQVWDSLQHKMQAKGVKLDVDVDLGSEMIGMSEVDCHRILMNIAENALKFSPEGSSIFCRIVEQDANVSISIKDQGYGIPEVHLKRVVERFYRVDNVRGREKQEGHGLGLAIVKETLERDGGHLLLENSEEGGLLVTIIIPKSG
jgi:two-component system phosphate regulon sensor histidine kinase PhoR